jgi:probable HAF family extracellular repeat protein
MKKASLEKSQYLLAALGLLAATATSLACGQGSTTITALPTLGGSSVQPNGFNRGSLVTGLSYTAGNLSAHAFIYKAGQLSDLGTLGGSTSIGHAVNSYGQVAAESGTPGDSQTHACLGTGGEWRDLGTLGGSYSTARALNDSGQVVGISLLEDGTIQGFLYSGGAMQSVGSLGGDFSDAIAINEKGTIIGDSLTADYENHAYLYVGGQITDLGTFGGGYSSAYGINHSDMVVGESALANGQTHAFSYANGVLSDLGTFGGDDSGARAVNDSGEIIGLSTTPTRQTHGFIYQNDVLLDLGTLGGGSCQPYAINNAAQVVGDSPTATGRRHAFLWQNGNMVDMNSLLPAGSGWELSSAQFINDDGEIVGQGYYNGTMQWFLFKQGAANQPPAAIAGPDQTVACGTAATLDGSQSSDPDQDPLQFEWSLGGTVLGTNPILLVSLPEGTNTLILKVTDVCGASSQAPVTVYVRDENPPAVVCPLAANAAVNANCEAPVPNLIPNLVVSDDCSPVDSLKVTQNPAPGTLVGSGVHQVTFTVTDKAGNTATCSTPLSVRDVTPPQIVSASVTPAVLSPPNHQMVAVKVSIVASDNCDPAPVTRIVSITCNEAADPGDTQIKGDLGALLAATKNASGDARVYTLQLETTDASGNTATGSVAVQVPKSNSHVTPNKGGKKN